MFLLDPQVGGRSRQSDAAVQDALFCNEEVDFQDAGSWGALSTWEDAGRQPVDPGAVLGAGALEVQVRGDARPGDGRRRRRLQARRTERQVRARRRPGCRRDMKRGEPVIVANGMVFGYGSGEETKQSWPDIGLKFDSIDPRGEVDTRDALRARRPDRQGAVLERRTDHLVQSFLRADRRERPRLYRDLRRHAVLLRTPVGGLRARRADGLIGLGHRAPRSNQSSLVTHPEPESLNPEPGTRIPSPDPESLIPSP